MAPKQYGSIEDGNELEMEPGSPSSQKTALRGSNVRRSAFLGLAVIAGAVIFLVSVPHAIHKTHTSKRPWHKKNHHKEDSLYFDRQIVDHDDPERSGFYSQKYYEDTDFFAGKGHPIFVIMGGEDALSKILYPFISEHLGLRFSAYTICIEHRFYGESWPIKHPSNANLRQLLRPDQALKDAVRLIQHKQQELGCGPQGSPDYCPVMTVGGSYPGFLAALMRMVHPETVDIGYASSAPLNLYSHSTDQSAYFDKVTMVADQASPGCADAVRTALYDVQDYILNSGKDIATLAEELGVCVHTIPNYITTNAKFAEEVMMVISTHFAENNMGYYPPSQDSDLIQGCLHFQNRHGDSIRRVNAFLRMREGFTKCFDMVSELPPGPNGTISAADWSGVGDGHSGWMWDFQSCTLIPECGMSEQSMFPPRRWTLDWLTQHCEDRFDYTPVPRALVDEFHFDDLTDKSRLLFTNGINDGWSVASIVVDISDSVKAINFPNGAHHSDLTHNGPTDADTPDIKEGHARIGNLIAEWLDDVREEQRF